MLLSTNELIPGNLAVIANISNGWLIRNTISYYYYDYYYDIICLS